MDKQTWLQIDHTQDLISKLKLAVAEMTEFSVHKDRIGETVDHTAQQFCFCSGFIHAMEQALEKVVTKEVEVKDKDDPVVGEEYSDA